MVRTGFYKSILIVCAKRWSALLMVKKNLSVIKSLRNQRSNQKPAGGFLIAHCKRYLGRYDPLDYKRKR